MNNQTKNILVPFDFSEEAMFGLNMARQWSEMVGAKVNMVHFVLPDNEVKDQHPKYAVLDITDPQRQKQIEQVAAQKLIELKKVLDEHIGLGAQGEVIVLQSGLSDAFEQFMQQTEIDLIISGTSSSRNIAELFTGNNSEQMLRDADIPVLVVSSDQALAFDNILLATDLGQAVPSRLFDFAKYFQSKGAELHVMNAMTTELMKEKDAATKMDQLVRHAGIEKYSPHLIEADDELEGVLKSVSEIDPDLILMKTHERSDLENAIFGSLTEKVIRQTSKPVLVQPMPAS